jgi:hypothetical protein
MDCDLGDSKVTVYVHSGLRAARGCILDNGGGGPSPDAFQCISANEDNVDAGADVKLSVAQLSGLASVWACH